MPEFPVVEPIPDINAHVNKLTGVGFKIDEADHIEAEATLRGHGAMLRQALEELGDNIEHNE